jgi:hypothetical protein
MITKEELRQIILKDLRMDSLSVEIQDKILEKLGGNIIKRISLAVLKALPEEARPEFEKISESGDEIKMQEFFKNTVPNFEELMSKTIKETIEEYKQMAEIK